CIEALDGTHVHTSIPLSIQGRFRSCKGGTTHNVFAANIFVLKFSYVLAGWKCSAHDSRILSDALLCPRGLRIPEEFNAQGPENAKELFNLRHSSLQITIERVLGIFKKRFHVLDVEPFWNFQTQVDIVLSYCVIHNHIMGVHPSDLLNQRLYEEPKSDLIIPTLTERKEREEAREWFTKREEIAQTMWNDYMAHKKYEPFLNKSIDHYDETALVVGKYMATGSFARTFANIDLDNGNQDSVPIDCDNKEIEEVRTKVSSSGTSKCKRKYAQESVVDEQIEFVGEQLGKIANALEQFTADKTSHLYEEVMSIEVERFDDDFLCSVFDYLVGHESEAKAFLVKSKKHRKIWLQKFSQG
ncbi:hypothetical protein J1N35_013753, partial [Gossypium stocksii]